MGALYLVATPIGNLEDITARALRVLREARVIAAEDTRRTSRLLRHFGISTPLLSYHAHNERARTDDLLVQLAAGDVALVSDAGTPGLSDPGYLIVAAAIAAGYPVVPVPGASALLAAVTASGLVPGPFTYLGFLPRQAARAAALLATAALVPHPLVVFEAPHRLVATLDRLLEVLGDRPAVAARELTKVHEEYHRGTLASLRAHYHDHAPRGEFVLVIGGPATPPPPPLAADDATALMADLLARGYRRGQAARLVARQTGQTRQALYRGALPGSGGTRDGDEEDGGGPTRAATDA